MIFAMAKKVKLGSTTELLQKLESLSENSQLESMEKIARKKPELTFSHLEFTDRSRKHIALVFVYGYIIAITIAIVCVPLYNWLALDNPETLDLEKIMAQLGAMIGSPLGFVVGYYFKEEARKDRDL